MAEHPSPDIAPEQTALDPYADHKAILELVKKKKDEYFENHLIFERQWQRMLNYLLNRQWIWWNPALKQWVDKKLAKWIPKPVTNILWPAFISIRAMFADVDLTAQARPNGQDPENVQTAATATDMEPVLKDIHKIPEVFNEADFWFINCGNVFLHTFWDKTLGGMRKQEVGPDGQELPELPQGEGKTFVLSPFEVGGPVTIPFFDDWPGLMVRRWRDKSFYEDNYPKLVERIHFSKTPSDRGLNVFKSLAVQNDIDPINIAGEFATGAGGLKTEGIEEYELHLKPNPTYPQGLIARIVGTGSEPLLLVDPDQSLPGPLPYTDNEGNSLWNWIHGGFESFGGRVWGRGALDGMIMKQDQINQLDSHAQLSLQRMANPIWMEPKGSEVERLTGEPGLVVKYNLLSSGGGKPERLEGLNPPSSIPQYRQQAMEDANNQSGTFEIAQGNKPPGVEAFSAIQALIERNQSRFKSPFKVRGRMHRDWFKIALELERQFGPTQRVRATMGPNRGWTFESFQNANLQGAVTIVVEDGSTMPKTNLGIRAAIDQAAQLQLLNPADPDERLAMLTHFGLAHMAPSLDGDVKSALQEQDAFERWVTELAQTGTPQTPNPLRVRGWHEPMIHYRENRKWMNSDRFRDILENLDPQMSELVAAVAEGHLQEHLFVLQPAAGSGVEGDAEGGGQALSSSNSESANPLDVPSGSQPGPNVKGGKNTMGPV